VVLYWVRLWAYKKKGREYFLQTLRCLTVSYKQIPLATDTFKLSTPPAIGMDTS
jgi:hypothetical protein